MPFATAEDVRVLIPRDELSPEEGAMIEKRIAKVERMIRRRLPDLDTRIADGRLTDEDVHDVVVESVLRVVRNPEGYSTEIDGNYSYTLRPDFDGQLHITDEEWESLGYFIPGAVWLAPLIRNPQL